MKKLKAISIFLLSILFMFITTACNEENNVTDPFSDDPGSDDEALMKLAEEDEAIESFMPNYNEEEALDFILPKTNTPIIPLRVGQRMRVINREMDIQYSGDSAYAKMTTTFEGIFFIAAAYDSTNTEGADTLIQKPFNTQVTRNLIFEKIANTAYPRRNWRIIAISLPEGGTLDGGALTDNIEITKMIVTMPTGDMIEVENPNEYYLNRAAGLLGQIPVIGTNETVHLRIELNSDYDVDDFVTLTYGARPNGFNRAKNKLKLISSVFNGVRYEKVYEAEYTTHQFPGYFHAVINAMPEQVIKDDATPVEKNSWAIPYRVL